VRRPRHTFRDETYVHHRIEEEYQTIDPETRDLRSHIMRRSLKGQGVAAGTVKAEMHQSVVEVGTGVCKNIKEAKAK